jgi:hypothetical protein
LLILGGNGAASADPFDPEMRVRPRLLLFAEDLSLVQERVTRDPYAGWMAQLRSKSLQAPAPFAGYDPVREYANGNIAKAAAFVALVDADSSAAERALATLEICAESVPNLTLNPLLVGEDIHLAEGLMLYSQALDLLYGSHFISAADSAAVEDRLAGLVHSTYQRYVVDNPYQYHLTMNNHRSKLAAAVGIAALAMNEQEDASLWIDWGMTVVDDILTHQTVESDGTYGEGPDYLSYAAVNHLPFAWAFHLFRGGAGGTFTYRRYGLFGHVVYSEEREMENPITSDLYAALDGWGVTIRRFDGLRSPMDDANPEGFFSFFGAAARDDAVLAWDWWEADERRVQDVADLRADVICVADDGQPRMEPAGPPTRFLPDGGHALLREGWGRLDTRVHVLAEHGVSRVSGGLHEHPDATSFMIEAHAEPLAIDSGYGRWEDRLAVNNAENHNLILVDGEGPPSPELVPPIGVDGWQSLQVDTERLDAVRVGARYRDTDVERVVAVIEGRWVAVLDQVAPSGGTHDLTWMLHGNGGGTTGGAFALTADGARWDRDGGSLVAHLASGRGGGVSLAAREMEHGLHWGSMESHMALEASVGAVAGATFAGLLDLPAAGEEEALVQDLSRSGAALLLAWFPDGSRAFLGSREVADTLALGPLRFDGRQTLLVEEAGGGAPAAMLLTEATSVRMGAQGLFQAEAPVDFVVAWEPDRIECHIEGGGGVEVTLWVGCEAVAVTGAVSEWAPLPGGYVRLVADSEPDAVDLVVECGGSL